jgi:hypothetical protein
MLDILPVMAPLGWRRSSSLRSYWLFSLVFDLILLMTEQAEDYKHKQLAYLLSQTAFI